MTDYEDDGYGQDDVGDSILDIDTSGAQEPTAQEEGEYKIRITGFSKDRTSGKIVRTSDSGFRYFIILFDIPSEEFSKGFSQIYSVPTDQMEPKQANRAKWDLECVKTCFGLTEINFDQMIGKEGYALLGYKEDPERGPQNFIKKLTVDA